MSGHSAIELKSPNQTAYLPNFSIFFNGKQKQFAKIVYFLHQNEENPD
jgi:hypothetical protein